MARKDIVIAALEFQYPSNGSSFLFKEKSITITLKLKLLANVSLDSSIYCNDSNVAF